jgi:mRNA-degrading endonuclease RelE of RelBE toxin-antitoxin system
MTYRVVYTDRVIADIRARIIQLREAHAGEHVIDAWFGDLFDAIDYLYAMPRLYPVDEPFSQRRGVEIRKLTFRKYVVRYRVDDEARMVYVLSFFHGAFRREA